MPAGISIATRISDMSMKTLQEIRKEHIGKVLEETRWNLKKASIILEIPEDVLLKEINKAGIVKRKPHPAK
jgi:transcriptional regulator with GAF, ATPase, and Fis domain